MNREFKPVTRGAAAAAMLILSGCGGSGGGGDSLGGTKSLQKPTLDPAEYASRKASLADIADIEAMRATMSALSFGPAIMGEVSSKYAIGDLAAAATSQTEQVACTNGGSVTRTIEYSETTFTDQFAFSDCRIELQYLKHTTLNGSATYSAESHYYSPESGAYKKFYRFEFDLTGRLVPDNIRFRVRGASGTTDEKAENGEFFHQTVVPSMEVAIGPDYLAVSDYKSTMKGSLGAFEGDDPYGSYTTVTGGKLVSSDMDGYLKLSTPLPIKKDHTGCAVHGIMTVAGQGQAEIRFGESTGTSDFMVVEINGNRAEYYRNCHDYRNGVVQH